jgi:signal transduction histidine kinase
MAAQFTVTSGFSARGPCRWTASAQSSLPVPLLPVIKTVALLEGGPVLICTLRDILERQAIQRELIQTKEAADLGKRAMREFLANMSHELRTPLNSIIGFAQFMEQGLFGDLGNERYRGYAGDIHHSAAHLLDIINDILDLSKLEAGEHILNEEEFALAPVIDGCLHMLQSRAESQKVALTSQIANSVHALHADRCNVKQILINLLSNAVKFTPAGGKVRVAAAADDTGLVISIADTGIGMAADDIAVALAPFRQLDSDLNRKFEGTGLGLPLVRSLIAAHGGTLEILSAPGAGTTVEVRFPPGRLRPKVSVE